ncbi:hypothetical protein CPB84DRAFT_1853499 [Gymnopilus junonius]|uniref:Cytochrome P450 n=1 Tax=Gymnopilus junonius TaxID=109634 RepID=A0A9P5NA39_GYMJU|nr:hypothetical protein CPB84DRAFT_1853499 [Gymnopilus junonius]
MQVKNTPLAQKPCPAPPLAAAITFLPLFKQKASFTYQSLLSEVKEVLNPVGRNVEEQLAERALANQRLVRALHLSNTFVSSDAAVHKVFVAHAQHLLKGAQRRGWEQFRNTATEAVQWQLFSLTYQSAPSESTKQLQEATYGFDSFVQNVALVVVLTGLLQVNRPLHLFPHNDVTLIAKHITMLWALSKKGDPIPPILLEDLTARLHNLVRVNGEDDEQHLSSPLDFVIPAWETLWRVVATTVAYTYGNKDMEEAFETFNACPSDESFRLLHGDKPLSVKGIISEAMRLHPPSKHISRLRKWKWCPSFVARWIGRETLAYRRQANIERLLRCEPLWGNDADEFRPSRHHPFEGFPEQVEAMNFVFGHGPLRCIASSWAPVAGGVIAGAILEQLELNSYELHVGPSIGGREGWTDWAVVKRI